MKALALIRIHDNDKATFGHIDDAELRVLGMTLEPPLTDALPAGVYTAHREHSAELGHDVFSLTDAVVEIRPGALPSDTKGRILVGAHFGIIDGKNGLTDPSSGFLFFMHALHGVDAFELTIADPDSTPFVATFVAAETSND